MIAELHKIWDKGFLAMTDEEYAAKQRRRLYLAEGLAATKILKTALSTFHTLKLMLWCVQQLPSLQPSASFEAVDGNPHSSRAVIGSDPTPPPPMPPKVRIKKKINRSVCVGASVSSNSPLALFASL